MFRITRGWKLSCCREIPLCCRRVLAVSGSAVVTHSAQRTCNNAFFFSRDQKRLCERRCFLDAVFLRCCVRSSSLASGQGGGKTVLCLYGAGREQPAGGWWFARNVWHVSVSLSLSRYVFLFSSWSSDENKQWAVCVGRRSAVNSVLWSSSCQEIGWSWGR